MKDAFSSRGGGGCPRVPLASRAISPGVGRAASEQQFCGGDAPSAEPASNISRILPATLISPEVLEPIGRKLGVSDGVLDVLMAEVVLQAASVHALVRQLVPAGMSEH